MLIMCEVDFSVLKIELSWSLCFIGQSEVSDNEQIQCNVILGMRNAIKKYKAGKGDRW